MSDPVQPRFELEAAPVERLQPRALVPADGAAGAIGRGGVGLVLAGAGVLVLGLGALETGNVVADQFARGAAFGWLTLALAAAGFGTIGAGIWRELRGLFALRTVDRLRAGLADPARVHAAAQEWLSDLPDGAATREAVRQLNDPDAVLALLRAGPAARLQARAEALGSAAAVQMVAITAAVPSAGLDALLLAWRGARLVRQVAELYGMRPGWLASLALLRRTALAAAGVAVADVALNATLRAVLSSRIAATVAGDLGAAGLAGRRMILLARAAAAACSPLPHR